jgi:hypothetical protein
LDRHQGGAQEPQPKQPVPAPYSDDQHCAAVRAGGGAIGEGRGLRGSEQLPLRFHVSEGVSAWSYLKVQGMPDFRSGHPFFGSSGVQGAHSRPGAQSSGASLTAGPGGSCRRS